ncbi:MAG TPA: hypothetical protein VFU51_01785 [Gaiellaceae bacterium]|nr:hypothetical protein [Gaiellaceae bacterium]
MEPNELAALIEQQAALMVAVATGAPRIEDKQREYVARRKKIRAELRRFGLEDPNPYGELWLWYGYWSQHLPNYVSRRAYVSALYQPLLDALEHLGERVIGTELQPAETGWGGVDHQLSQLRERYATAETREDCQAVGLLCRDIFRSLADATFQESHVRAGQVVPGPADAVARLGFVVDALAPGETNREKRKVIKATFDLANKVQHDRTATLDLAAIVAETTLTAVNLVRIVVLGANEVDEPDVSGFPDYPYDAYDEMNDR